MIRLNCGSIIAGSPNSMGGPSEFNIWGHVEFRGTCEMGTSNKIVVGENGMLVMGDGTRIMSSVNVTSYKYVEVGTDSWLVHRSQVMDTNYHYIADLKHQCVPPIAKPIIIGCHCWVCNNATITGGAVIPDYTIVAGSSLVNKDMSAIPPNSIIGGMPAQLIKTGYCRIDNNKLIKEILLYYNNNQDSTSYMCDITSDSCNR